MALDNWTLSTTFEPPPELLAAPAALLHFSGLDAAAADVSLNGARLGTAANAHRSHVWDVTGLLAAGRNELSVTLLSAPAVAAARAAAVPYAIPATRQMGSLPGYHFVRKAASDFGW